MKTVAYLVNGKRVHQAYAAGYGLGLSQPYNTRPSGAVVGEWVGMTRSFIAGFNAGQHAPEWVEEKYHRDPASIIQEIYD